MVKSYAEWLVRWRYLILIATVVLVAAAAGGLQFITFKTDYRVFFSDDNPQMLAFEQLQNTYTKTDNVLFVLAPKDGRVFTPETLATITWLTEQSWQLPYSIRVDSITNYQHTEAVGDDLLVDDLAIFEFYQQRIQHSQASDFIYSRAAFEQWRKKTEKKEVDYQLWIKYNN